VSDAERLAEIIRIGDSIHPDQLTDEAFACLTETLARYARKHLPEGYVLRLDCWAYDHEVMLWKSTESGDGLSHVSDAPREWGKACDYARQEGQQ